jgi:hypothetical protein
LALTWSRKKQVVDEAKAAISEKLAAMTVSQAEVTDALNFEGTPGPSIFGKFKR